MSAAYITCAQLLRARPGVPGQSLCGRAETGEEQGKGRKNPAQSAGKKNGKYGSVCPRGFAAFDPSPEAARPRYIPGKPESSADGLFACAFPAPTNVFITQKRVWPLAVPSRQPFFDPFTQRCRTLPPGTLEKTRKKTYDKKERPARSVRAAAGEFKPRGREAGKQWSGNPNGSS